MSSKKEKDLIAFCDANIGSMPKSKNISDMIHNQAWGVFDFMEVEEINNRVNNFSGTRVQKHDFHYIRIVVVVVVVVHE